MPNTRENPSRQVFTIQELFQDRKKLRRDEWNHASQVRGQIRILEQLGIEDLTQGAFAGRFRQPVGLRREVREIETVLIQRFANTPLIHGVNGPGKSTLPLKLAFRIVNGQCNAALRRHRLMRLDLSLLTAGAGMRGELEERLKAYFQLVDENPHIITVIDECQRLVGNHLYESEIIHCLKTRLGSGRYKMILITDAANINLLTEDAAIMGRVILVEMTPPDERRTLRLFKNGIGPELESHYKIRLPMDLVSEAYRLSEETMPYDRAQPSRTIKLIDYAMAA
ncbi:ATP-dependent Clp protease ATP-binding subunit, partial [candidate division KSB1 bacterium]|nr:ATP-dependent Clp protease ATP-binding subunit [candidate division KSB1 bacterium]